MKFNNIVMDTLTKLEKLNYIIYSHGGMDRLCKLFKTNKYFYLFDAGTGKIFQCSKEEYDFLNYISAFEKDNCNLKEFIRDMKESLLEDFNVFLTELLVFIEKNKILQAKFINKFYSPLHKECIEEAMSSIHLMTLELTEKCNLRCEYCIYNQDYKENRNFSERSMTEEIAFKAIDFLSMKSENKISIVFYGGEPLLKFDLLKKCVEYSKKVLKGKKISFGITTNLTLLTKEMATFFNKENFNITASIDGPKEIHDEYRKYKNGKGSFEDSLRGLKLLLNEYNEKALNSISISMVFAQPYLYSKLDEIQNFFDSLEWLPKEIEKDITYPEEGSVNRKIGKYDGIKISETGDSYISPISVWTKNRYLNDKIDITFTKKYLENTLSRIHNRIILEEPLDLYSFNGCCVPGNRRLYVTVNGDFKVCERIGNSPYIGNVYSGFNLDVIKKLYVHEYEKAVKEKCSKCWAVRLCDICYAKVFDKNGLNVTKLNKACIDTRDNAYNSLIYYFECYENKADLIKKVDKLHIC